MIEFKILLTQSQKQVISYDYTPLLHGVICELLGNGYYGRAGNDYTFSRICNVVYKPEGIYLSGDESYILIRCNDESAIQFLKSYSSIANRELFYGVHFNGFSIIQERNTEKDIFNTLLDSPILLSKSIKTDWLTEEQKLSSEAYLVNNVKTRAKDLNFEIDDSLEIKIIGERKHSDVKYGNVINKGHILKLKITADKKTKEFILQHGIGRSVGIGFGLIY